MGVRGLLTYLKRHPERLHRFQTLYTIASNSKTEHAPKLLCDFMSIFYWLLTEFHQAKIKCKDYKPYSNMYGGDLLEYEQRFIDFVTILKNNGRVDPIFFVDGDRGSDLKGFEAKLDTYQKRHTQRQKRIDGMIKPSSGTGQVDNSWIPPPLLVLHILMALKSEGIVVKHFVGEADSHMADYARKAKDVCGILTNDTDMVVMRGCEVIFCAFYDREAKLGIKSHQRLKPVCDVVCETVKPSDVADWLKIEESDLKNLSVICGNDYTSGLNFNYRLFHRLNLPRGPKKIENVAEWLRRTPHSPLHETSPLKEICEESAGQYKLAIEHTYEAYHDSENPSSDEHHEFEGASPFFQLVLSEVREGRMTTGLVPMAANSIHWRDQVVEDPTAPHGKSISDLLFPIRHLIYKLLGLRHVQEYGGLPYKERHIAVSCPDSSSLVQIRQHTEIERLYLLASFLAKAKFLCANQLTEFLNPQLPLCFNDTRCVTGLLKPLTICSSLLFAQCNKSADFSLDECVRDVYLITCCMCCLKVPLRKVHLKPNARAINVATGFACIIKYSYDLASLFGLLDVMPLPGHVYQPAAFIPYFQVATQPSAALLKKEHEMAETLHAYKFVTQKLSSFKKLKEGLREAHHFVTSSPDLIPARTILLLSVAFMEAMADIDEANKNNLLFVRDQDTPKFAAHSKEERLKCEDEITDQSAMDDLVERLQKFEKD